MATEKQKKAIAISMENRGNISKAMRDAGYSKQSAKNPKNLTTSKAWVKLMEKYLPDKDLARVHKEGLNATKKEGVGGMAISMNGNNISDMGHRDTFVPDYATRHKYLDTAYKLKDKYVAEKIHHEVEVNIMSFRNDTDSKK